MGVLAILAGLYLLNKTNPPAVPPDTTSAPIGWALVAFGAYKLA